jgi:hypothetical protein
MWKNNKPTERYFSDPVFPSLIIFPRQETGRRRRRSRNFAVNYLLVK